ncbi:MAG: ChaN family lipoprotein, partial [Planctomycetes bacterium]|nr:ChaN family lipoprotein [Planctomycetota bacterium]
MTSRRTVYVKLEATPARRELMEIQQRWVADLKDRIYETETRHNPQLDQYYDEYKELFQQGYETLLSRRKIVRRLAKADIAFFGDYHTLKLSQTTYVSLMEEIVRDFQRPVVFMLEMVESCHQRFIDDYLSDRMDEEEFLDAIRYHETWGFDWRNYKRIFDVARKHKIPVFGININVDGKSNSLVVRDKHAAQLIAAARVFYPNALIGVLYGDLHVAENHLPALTKRELTRLGTKANRVILYQNSETIYWSLVEKGIESTVDVVKMRPNVYCIMNATPLTKFQSWVSWQERDLEMGVSDSDENADMERRSQFEEVLETIDEFFGLKAEGLDDFSLLTSHELDSLENLKASTHYDEGQVDHIRQMLRAGRSVVIPQTRTLYLANDALNEAAWLAAVYLRLCCVGVPAFTEHFEPKDAFYVSVFDEALGTIGTLVMNPRYRVMTPFDHEDVILTLRGRRKLGELERLSKVVSSEFLAHREMVEARVSGSNPKATLRSIYRHAPTEYRAITRAIGRYFGACAFHAINVGGIPKSHVADLFKRRWERDEPFHAYLEMLESFGPLPDILR